MAGVLQVWVIALVVIVSLEGAWPRAGWSANAAAAPAFSWWLTLGALAPMGVIAGMVALVCRASARALDERGDVRAVSWADRTVSFSQPLTVASHATGVLALGLTDQIRALTGGLGLIDQAIALVPPLAVLVHNWWAMHPIERRLADAAMVRALDQGRPVYSPPTRREYMITRVRHDLLLILVPLGLIAAWGQVADFIVGRFAADQADFAELLRAGAQFVGVAAVLAVAPALLAKLWDTVRLGDGDLRDELIGLCRQAGVRVREVLVWRTHHAVVNAAAMGLIARWRYILLTDALLERLPREQVHAVMLHEIAHVRHRHIPWLIAGVVGAAGGAGALGWAALHAADFAVLALAPALDGTAAMRLWYALSDATVAAAVLAAVVVALGFISRRYEWQADAFAVQRLSAAGGASSITDAAAAAMVNALQSVADEAHVPVDRRSFRHGSIRLRQRKILALIGQPLTRRGVASDRVARRIKAVTVGLLVVTVIAAGLDWAAARADDPNPDSRSATPNGDRP
jgi:STE24 endopeptidase